MTVRNFTRFAVLALTLAAASCTSPVKQGTGTSFLIIEQMEFASGDDPNTFVGNLESDVLTVVDGNATVFNDLARVTFRLGLKDPGPATNATAPSQNQWITINRYHVRYMRTDGRNVQGVDVPYEWDGAFTVTVSDTRPQSVFNIVRQVAKLEPPLSALASNGVIVTMIAEITFYGQDQTGHDVTATARATINFGNCADPA